MNLRLAAPLLLVCVAAPLACPAQTFEPQIRAWSAFPGPEGSLLRAGCVDRGSTEDLVLFVRDSLSGESRGSVWLSLSGAEAGATGRRVHDLLGVGEELPLLGDFDRDGKKDAYVFIRSTKTDEGAGDVGVALSDGRGFGELQLKHEDFCRGALEPWIGDVDGDQRDDIIAFVKSRPHEGVAEGEVYVAMVRDDAFGPSERWNTWFGIGQEQVAVGDFTGDGRADIATWVPSDSGAPNAGTVYVGKSLFPDENRFADGAPWAEQFGTDLRKVVIVARNINNDRFCDLIAFSLEGDAAGRVVAALSNGERFDRVVTLREDFARGEEWPFVADLNGDAKPDLAKISGNVRSLPFQGGNVYASLNTTFGPGILPLGVQPVHGAATEQALRESCARFSGYDMDGNGVEDIHRLEVRRVIPSNPPEHSRGLVIVLLEQRLQGMEGRMAEWLDGISKAGYTVGLVTASVYGHAPGENRHQDGRTLLALREFLRAVRSGVPTLRGLMLVGNYPDAVIIRRCMWPQGPGRVTVNGVQRDNVRWIDNRAGIIAFNSEIVLADLDGRWEDLYAEPLTTVPGVIAAFSANGPDYGNRTTRIDLVERFNRDAWQDVFIVRDGDFRIEENGDTARLFFEEGRLNPECSDADLALANPMAIPELMVSRINAKRVGVAVNPAIRGDDGGGMVGTDGRPAEVRLQPGVPSSFEHWWVHSQDMEERLLVDFFGRVKEQWARTHLAVSRPAALAHGFPSAMPHLRRLFHSWRNFERPGYDLADRAATLPAAMRWLQNPAAIRAVEAHGGGFSFQVGAAASEQEIVAAAGNVLWSWKQSGDRLMPGISSMTEVGFPILRSLWENRLIAPGGVVYWLSGCESITPPWALDRPFSDPKYGYLQGAESLLFYGNGIALIGRSKIFNERPDGFLEALSEEHSCGEGWVRFYQTVSQRPNAAEAYHNIARKRPYLWSLLGDWTVTVPQARSGASSGGGIWGGDPAR